MSSDPIGSSARDPHWNGGHAPERPLEIGTRYRVYTTQEQRRAAGFDGSGYRQDAYAVCVNLDVTREEQSGRSIKVCHTVAFPFQFEQYGEFVIPPECRDALQADVGDTILVSINKL